MFYAILWGIYSDNEGEKIMEEGIRKYLAKLVNNNGFWFVECENLGTIDLGDDIPEWLELMMELDARKINRKRKCN